MRICPKPESLGNCCDREQIELLVQLEYRVCNCVYLNSVCNPE